MQCTQCGFISTASQNFCGQCGAKLKPSNESLNFPTEQSKQPVADEQSLLTRFLTPQLSHKILATRGKIEGERRQVTALFVDIKGYTPLSEQLGEEAIYRLMERLYELMITSVHEEEGNVQKLTGDGIFALFGAPIALEDAPLRACRAALAIQRKMKQLGDELEKEKNIRPLARIGINTGPVVVGTVGTDLRMEFTAQGDTVNLASRMESIAEPGCVYISEATHALAGPYTETTFIGERQVKGKTEPQKVYRVDGLKEHAVRFDESMRRGLTPLAGRTEELAELEELCAETIKGKTLLVQIVGEPGVGKSRVMHEFHERLDKRDISYLRSNCMSFGQSTSFLPFTELVKNLFQINEGDNLEIVENKILTALDSLSMEATAQPFLLNFLSFPVKDDSLKGLDARIIGDRTREILMQVFINRSRQNPTVLVIEDLHWIDPASEQLLHQLIIKESSLPLMILTTTRPAYNALWLDEPGVKVMKLVPLSKESVKQMVGSILESHNVADEINAMIIDKAGCNPFFTEEMTRYLLESKSLKKTEQAVLYELTGVKASVPTTILDLLQTRVDKLDENLKTILQTAAIVGQRFAPELVKRVTGVNGEFTDHLKKLEEQDLIFPEQVGNSVEYRFKHALLQDVIYDNLLKTRRKKLHAAVGEAIEHAYSDRLDEQANVLAYHWSNTDNAGQAVRYLAMAGRKSTKVFALKEAHDRFKQAIDLIEKTPGCVEGIYFADILLDWARVYYHRADWKGMTKMLEPYLSQIETLDDKRRLSLFLFWLGHSHTVAGRGAAAKPLLKKAKALGDAINDDECIAFAAEGLLWLYSYWIPDSVQSDKMVYKCFEEISIRVDKINDLLLYQEPLFGMTVYSFFRARYAEARSYCTKLMEYGRKIGDDQTMGMALWSLGGCHLFEERYEETLECTEQSIQISPDQHGRGNASAIKGGALALTGRVQEGLELMLKTRQKMIEDDFVLPRAAVEIPIGAVTALAGRMSEGIEHIEHAMKYWASLGNYTQPVWGHLFLSDIYLKIAFDAPPPLPVILKNLWFVLTNKPVAKRKAKYHLEEVIRKSREYNMPGFLAKALYGLGVLAQAKKKHDEARAYFVEALKVAEENQLYIAEKVRTALNDLTV